MTDNEMTEDVQQDSEESNEELVTDDSSVPSRRP